MDLWWNCVHSGRSKVELGPITQQRLLRNSGITLLLVLSGRATGPKVIILGWKLGCTWRAVWFAPFMEKEKEKWLGTDRGKMMGRLWSNLCRSWSDASPEIRWPQKQMCNCSRASRWQRRSIVAEGWEEMGLNFLIHTGKRWQAAALCPSGKTVTFGHCFHVYYIHMDMNSFPPRPCSALCQISLLGVL